MEEFQKGYLAAIAAASGCVIAEFNFDDGIDAQLNHTSDAHTAITDRTARLEIQLKATYQAPPKSGGASIQMTQDRFDYYRIENPTLNKIVIVMHMPEDPSHWILASRKHLRIHHCSYWVNLAGRGPSTADRPTVTAPASNVFDDAALCAIMERIGTGGSP